MVGNTVVDGLVINMRDVADRLLLEEQLRRRAFRDPHTGLANRALFLDRLDQVAAERLQSCLKAIDTAPRQLGGDAYSPLPHRGRGERGEGDDCSLTDAKLNHTRVLASCKCDANE